jgi:hypothetical protein
MALDWTPVDMSGHRGRLLVVLGGSRAATWSPTAGPGRHMRDPSFINLQSMPAMCEAARTGLAAGVGVNKLFTAAA